MTTLKYEGVTPEQIKSLPQELTNGGANVSTIDANNYEVTGHGIDAKAYYNPATKELTVTVISKPWMIPIGVIDHGIQNALNPATPPKNTAV